MAETLKHVSGLAELERAMKALPGKIQEHLLVLAVSRAAKTIQKEMQTRAPIRAGGGPKWTAKGHRGAPRMPGYLRLHIGRKRINRQSGDSVTYEIGPTKSAFYGLMVELGTRYAAKRPFMRPALDAKGETAVSDMADTLRSGLDRAVRDAKGA